MKDKLITRIIQIAGFSSIIIVLMIFLFLLREGLPALYEVALSDLFTSGWVQPFTLPRSPPDALKRYSSP